MPRPTSLLLALLLVQPCDGFLPPAWRLYGDTKPDLGEATAKAFIKIEPAHRFASLLSLSRRMRQGQAAELEAKKDASQPPLLPSSQPLASNKKNHIHYQDHRSQQENSARISLDLFSRVLQTAGEVEFGQDDALFHDALDFQWSILEKNPTGSAAYLACSPYTKGRALVKLLREELPEGRFYTVHSDRSNDAMCFVVHAPYGKCLKLKGREVGACSPYLSSFLRQNRSNTMPVICYALLIFVPSKFISQKQITRSPFFSNQPPSSLT